MLRIRKPHGARKRLTLTPLIDVIFILVMFFLLSSTFGVWRPLDILLTTPSGNGQPVAAPAKVPAILITVRPAPVLGAARLTINGVDVAREEMVGELDRLAALGAASALLQPAPEMDFQTIVRLLDLARSSRIGRVTLKVD